MAIGIYKITNKVNSKFYIGSTIDSIQRKSNHKYRMKAFRGNSIIRNAVLKYGNKNFEFNLIEEFKFGDFATRQYVEELITSREQYYVDILNPEYNIRKKDVTSGKGESTKYIGNTSCREVDRKRKEKAKITGGHRRTQKEN